MSKIFRSLSEPGLLAAVEHNFAEEMACFGRNLPAGILHQDDELTWFMTGPTGPNGVLLTNFGSSDPEYIDRRIAETLALFRSHQVLEPGWRVGAADTPADLASYLERHGLQLRATMTCMILDTATAQTVDSWPDGLDIREVLTVSELQTKCEIEKIGFGATEVMAGHYYHTYLASGFGEGAMWHHYIGSQQGKAVAVASILLHQGVAGIYGVTTLPEARRQGIASALTQHIISEVRRLGYAIATLSPSDMSEAIYRRLGFQDYCQLHHYRVASPEENRAEL
ncbi:GNAT family N-acetyltransferase [Dictyobacter kobayashii]|uniref:N-acetyltransferase domain-containing protein n=1 Tax=Dictyobacter kobayashii TaxID=2014872 RepID=A0A402AMG8_9CHLR|nr:GNAT family N-acetyltransferase [Dictyobacter kobayashii]GCE20190.1 hypothetical protein KDK_39900 [Dictyobacter kobayashii]